MNHPRQAFELEVESDEEDPFIFPGDSNMSAVPHESLTKATEMQSFGTQSDLITEGLRAHELGTYADSKFERKLKGAPINGPDQAITVDTIVTGDDDNEDLESVHQSLTRPLLEPKSANGQNDESGSDSNSSDIEIFSSGQPLRSLNKTGGKQNLTSIQILDSETGESKISTIRGLIYMITANFFLSVMALCVRITAGSKLTPFQLVFSRSLISLLAVAVYTWKRGESFWGPKHIRVYMISRGVFGFFAVATYYLSIRLIPLSDAVVVSFLIPPFTAIGATFVLKESYTKIDAITSGISLMGVILVARPTFLFGENSADREGNSPTENDRLLGVVYGLFSALFSSCAYISIRKAGKEAGIWILTGYFSISALVGSVICALAVQEYWALPSSVGEWWILIGVGIASLFGQLCVNAGLKCEKAGLASSMNYTQVIFAIFWELSILDDAPSSLSMVGASMIICCASYNIYQKYTNL